MKSKKPLILLLISLLTVSATGCWDYKELEELGIIYAIAIDLEDVEFDHHEKEDFEVGEGEPKDKEQNKHEKQYVVTAQLIEPTSIMGGEKKGMTINPSWNITTTKANSIKKAIEEINARIYREPLLSHIRVVLIGEDLAREGLTGALDYIVRDPHIRKGMSIVVTKGKAKDTLNLEHETTSFSGKYLSRLSETSNKYGGKATFTITDLGVNMFKNKSYIVPRVALSPAGNEVVFGGGALFKSDKMIGWIGERELTDINLIKEKDVLNIPISATCPGEDNNTFALALESKKSKYDVKYVNDKIHLNIKMYLIADVSEMNCKGISLNDEDSRLIENTFSKSLEKELTYTFKQIQKKFGTDVYEFDDYLNKYHHDIWKKVEKDWDEYFTNMDLNIEVITSLRTGGSENLK